MANVILICSDNKNQLEKINLNKEFTLHFNDLGIIEKDNISENELYKLANYIQKNINTDKVIVIKEKTDDNKSLVSLKYLAHVSYVYNDANDTWSIEKFVIEGNKIIYKQILNYLNRIE